MKEDEEKEGYVFQADRTSYVKCSKVELVGLERLYNRESACLGCVQAGVPYILPLKPVRVHS